MSVDCSLPPQLVLPWNDRIAIAVLADLVSQRALTDAE